MKRQLMFKLYEDGNCIGTYSTFAPEALRPESIIALRVSNLFGADCVCHQPGHAGGRRRVTFFDPSSETFREMEAEIL